MIINGGSRAGGAFFSRHLMRADENERVSVVEIRGLAAGNVRDAFSEMEAVASGTRVQNYFYHANMNTRADEHLTPEQWEQATDTLERELGLTGQPRFVVEHEKEGRTHRHVVWSRIDADSMTAISDSLTYRKHELAAREIEQEFGLEPVESVLVKDRDGERPERRPKDWESFRGQDSRIDPHAMKAEITVLWQEADSGQSFKAALEDAGYILAKGDRRDFCVIDQAGDEHSLARRISGAKAAEIRARMSDIDQGSLPTVAEARERVREEADAPNTAPTAQDYHSAEVSPEPGGDQARRSGQAEPEPPSEDRPQEGVGQGALAPPDEAASQPGGWRHVAQEIQARAVEFLRDETSGKPEAERGVAARAFDAGRKLWGGWHRRDGHEFAEGIEEAARLARDVAGDLTPPPGADSTDTPDPNAALPAENAESSLSWDEQKRHARDAIAGAEPFAQQIRAHGEIRHQGLGGITRWQRVVEFARELYRDARERIADTWAEWVGSRGEREAGPEHDLER